MLRKYYDNWQNEEFDCPNCKWHGPGSALVLGDHNFECAERLCPVCEECITVVLHPTFEEARANWDKVSEWDRKNIKATEAFQAEFKRRKLRKPAQLPDIAEPSFTLSWDFVDEGSHKKTLIKCGDKIIFAEPALWEGYERFVEVAEILRARYGAALCDLMPTAVSELYLYGDYSGSSRVVAAARKRIFDGSGKEGA
jgi:hypothetical protein